MKQRIPKGLSVPALLLALLLAAAILGTAAAEVSPWDCPQCGRTGNTGNFCGGCGHPAPQAGEAGVAPAADVAQADGTVIFGRWEQDDNEGNGQEPIEWLVLEDLGDRALLVSRYGLDVQAYDDKKAARTWEDCFLRAWLNDEFYDAAFTGDERARIAETELDNSCAQGYPDWSTADENATVDRVFLLSYADVHRYFAVDAGSRDNTAGRLAATEYSKAKGAKLQESCLTEEGLPAAWWWVRSTGSAKQAIRVSHTGALDRCAARKSDGMVRPALWLMK